ncbi:MAG: hypothetical protein NC040_09865 [Muribaculaceae bacterium]|nr:hypothetical protein [Muribaculaceae bacterium]
MKKHAPYSEIIDISEELKEYRKLCRGKSKKFIYYLDWKKYISEKISRLDTPDKKENFKHYLINHNRVNKNTNSYFITLMIFCMNLYINKIDVKFNFLSLTISIIIIIFQMIYQSDVYEKEYCFYCDLIEILEEIEKEEAESCPTPKLTMKKQ